MSTSRGSINDIFKTLERNTTQSERMKSISVCWYGTPGMAHWSPQKPRWWAVGQKATVHRAQTALREIETISTWLWHWAGAGSTEFRAEFKTKLLKSQLVFKKILSIIHSTETRVDVTLILGHWSSKRQSAVLKIELGCQPARTFKKCLKYLTNWTVALFHIATPLKQKTPYSPLKYMWENVVLCSLVFTLLA